MTHLTLLAASVLNMPLLRVNGDTTDTLTDITRTAIEAAFVDEPTRSKLLQRLA